MTRPDERTLRELSAALSAGATSKGYYINDDWDLTKVLIAGLLENRERYGYMSCPCRLSSGDIKKDRDIICPCDYRDADIAEYGMCYCALYVSEAVHTGITCVQCIPDRRPVKL